MREWRVYDDMIREEVGLIAYIGWLKYTRSLYNHTLRISYGDIILINI